MNMKVRATYQSHHSEPHGNTNHACAFVRACRPLSLGLGELHIHAHVCMHVRLPGAKYKTHACARPGTSCAVVPLAEPRPLPGQARSALSSRHRLMALSSVRVFGHVLRWTRNGGITRSKWSTQGTPHKVPPTRLHFKKELACVSVQTICQGA